MLMFSKFVYLHGRAGISSKSLFDLTVLVFVRFKHSCKSVLYMYYTYNASDTIIVLQSGVKY